MHPVICTIGPFTVYAYGLMLAFAFIVSSTLAAREAKRKNINPEIIFNFSFLIFICGIIGARIFYTVENLSYYLKNPLEIIMLQHGGLSWYGGLVSAAFFGIVYLKKIKQPLYKIFDLIAPFLALGQAIGRIGCFLNGCCFGKVSRFGLYSLAQKAVIVPTQIYSAIILVFIFISLRLLQKKPRPPGQIFYLYLLLYSLKRFIIEFWRADNPVIISGLTLFQLISIVIFIFSAIELFLITRHQRKNAGI